MPTTLSGIVVGLNGDFDCIGFESILVGVGDLSDVIAELVGVLTSISEADSRRIGSSVLIKRGDCTRWSCLGQGVEHVLVNSDFFSSWLLSIQVSLRLADMEDEGVDFGRDSGRLKLSSFVVNWRVVFCIFDTNGVEKDMKPGDKEE